MARAQGPGPRAAEKAKGKRGSIQQLAPSLPLLPPRVFPPTPPAVSTLPFHLPCASFAYTMHMQHLVIEVLDFLEPLPVGADDERIADSEEGL